MNLLITGGTGFIGAALCKKLLDRAHRLTVLSRRPQKVKAICGESVRPLASLADLSSDDAFDAIINLAGEGLLDRRWTPDRKRMLMDSRIGTTEKLMAYIAAARRKPELLLSGSAVGYYGDRGDTPLDETSAGGDGFGHELCAQWEGAALKAEEHGIRVCLLRTGLVIGAGGGFLKRMLLPFKLGLGGPIGHGRQWMSWIHRDDLIAMIESLLNQPHLRGPVNGTAPNPVTNKEFTQTLAKLLYRPAFLRLPPALLRLAVGEMAALLLGGQRVLPARMQADGFQFQFETLQKALSDVLQNTPGR